MLAGGGDYRTTTIKWGELAYLVLEATFMPTDASGRMALDFT